MLTPSQAEVVRLVERGDNVFFTGAAGTGKSHTLHAALAALRARYDPSEVCVTAPTGLAATAVGGTTLHAAMGLGCVDAEADFERMWRVDTVRRLRSYRALVIDEISMLSGELFHVLDHTLRKIRGCDDAFGGLQLVACGDFMQLPPVSSATGFRNRLFAFQSPSWAACGFHTVLLAHVFRQTDTTFRDLLARLRDGEEAALDLIGQLAMASAEEAGDVAPPQLQLVTTNEATKRINHEELRKLGRPEFTARARDSVEVRRPGDADMLRPSFGNMSAPPLLPMRVGARVILLKNTEMWRGLANGSTGRIMRFVTRASYAADWRRRLRMVGDAQQLLESWGTPDSRIPIVRWDATEEATAVGPQAFEATLAGVGTARRVQLPLKLAWALTVHRAQGMSLDAVRVSLPASFADGQAYVAVSRARTLEGLDLRFKPGCVRASAEARAFHASLEPGAAPFVCDAWQRLDPPPAAAPDEPARVRVTPDTRAACFKCGADEHASLSCPVY